MRARSRSAGVVEGSDFTVVLEAAGTVTCFANDTLPNRPRSVPVTAFSSLLRRVASTLTSARLLSGRGRVVEANAFSMVTGPLVVR